MGEAGLPVHEVTSPLVNQPPGMRGTVMNSRVFALLLLTLTFGRLSWLIPLDTSEEAHNNPI